MSGICGIIYFDGKVIGHELSLMLDTMPHRGLDGIKTYQHQNVALAFLHLQVRPKQDAQPLTTSTGETIVADARIDDPTTTNNNDLEIIAKNYQKYGNDLVQHLTGDFAIAIWDEQNQKLLLARDHAAARPLYYCYQKGKYVAFASEKKALLALPFVAPKIDTDKVLRYIDLVSYLRPYNEQTFYENIKSIPPAYCYSFDNESITKNFGWNIDLQKYAHLKTDDDFVKEFSETFREAIKCRLRTDFAVSSHLSGGLDSSAVSMVAKKLHSQPICTLHIDAGPTADEKMYAEAVLATGGFVHEYVLPLPNLPVFMEEIAQILDQPDGFTLLPIHHLAVAKKLQKSGSRILFTGHDGDSVVGYGRNHLLNLLQQKKWSEFKKLLTSYASVADFESAWPHWNGWTLERKYQQLLSHYIKGELKPLLRNKQLGKALLLWVNASFRLGLSQKLFLGNFFGFLNQKRKDSSIKKWGFTDEYNTFFDPQIEEQMSDIWHEGMLECTEQHEQIAAHHAHEMAHPFYDRRLVELCLAIPDRLKFDNGYRRGPLRRAMLGILPEEVRLRTSKVKFDGTIGQAMLENYEPLTQTLDQAIKKIQENNCNFSPKQQTYLLKNLKNARHSLKNNPNKTINYARAFHLAFWLTNPQTP